MIAHQVCADECIDADECVAGEGWRRQTTIGEPRLSEIVQAYLAMGFEVRVEAFEASVNGGCTSCFTTGHEMGFRVGTVYVRRRGEAPEDDDLF